MTVRGGLRSVLALALLAGPTAAADLDLPSGYGRAPQGTLRYFPRSDGSESRPTYLLPARPLPIGCVLRQVPVPTNAPDDPSYVGSEYGLARPSRYGFTPPPGIDDPSGRPLLPYCP